eukprot:15279690-Alexandrium_andersonii.AAC.1
MWPSPKNHANGRGQQPPWPSYPEALTWTGLQIGAPEVAGCSAARSVPQAPPQRRSSGAVRAA